MAGRGHNGHAWRQLWRAIIEGPEFLVCALCFKPIDRGIRGRKPASPSVDMIVPWSRGGDPMDPTNLRPAHFSCNARRGAGNTVQRNWIVDDSP